MSQVPKERGRGRCSPASSRSPFGRVAQVKLLAGHARVHMAGDALQAVHGEGATLRAAMLRSRAEGAQRVREPPKFKGQCWAANFANFGQVLALQSV